MEIVLNGKREAIERPCTVAALIDHRGLAGAPCAVEVNRVLVPKASHAEHLLDDGDVVEIVTLVGGG